ncbi:ArsR family transcriptional regulator [Bacillus licheniformis]|nr:ArsR family transcriptional regulator [Bacillus licheniformis]
MPLHKAWQSLRRSTAVLQALSDPYRLEIVKALADTAEKTCGTCTNLNIAKSTLSHHFKVLREAGLLKVRIEGKHHYYSLIKPPLCHLEFLFVCVVYTGN